MPVQGRRSRSNSVIVPGGLGLLLSLGLSACTEPPAPAASRSGDAAPTPTGGAAALQDGDYSAKGWYGGGPSSIDVTVVLRSGRVDAVEVQPNASDPTSLDYQRRFAAGVADLVVGRPLAELGDVVVSGSSGTPAGYDDAVRQIAAEARR